MSKINKILSGDLLKSDFFKKNNAYIILISIIIFFYIIYGSIGVFQVAKIDDKKKHIYELRQKSILISADLMQISLESKINQEIIDRNMDLQKLSEPPMKIIIDK